MKRGEADCAHIVMMMKYLFGLFAAVVKCIQKHWALSMVDKSVDTSVRCHRHSLVVSSYPIYTKVTNIMLHDASMALVSGLI